MEQDHNESVEGILTPSQNLGNFFIYWAGQLFSILGSSIVFFSIIWWITEETQSAVFLSIASTLSFLPQLIITPIAGVYSDLWDRKLTIFFADLFQALTTFLVILYFTVGGPSVWLIIGMNSLRGIFQSFHQPASSAVIPLMVPQEKISRIHGISTFMNGIIRIIGPAVGAVLLGFLTITQVLWVDVITFIIAATFLMKAKIPKLEKKKIKSSEKPSFWKEFKLGFITMKNTPGLLTLASMCTFVNFLLLPVNVLMAFFVNVTHSGLEGDMALIMGMMQIGTIMGSIIVTLKKKWKNKQKAILVTGIFMFIGNIILAVAPPGNFVVIGIGRFIFGVNISIGIVLYYTILQISVPPEQQGRIFSIDATISLAITPIAMIIAGPLSDLLGIVNFFIILGVIGIIVHAVIWLFTGLIKVDYDNIIQNKSQNNILKETEFSLRSKDENLSESQSTKEIKEIIEL